MTTETILIAGFSGRALAQSARRAGYGALVVDAFGDDDTLAAALAVETLPAALARGFSARALCDALARLVARAPSPPLGLVLAAGFEDRPALVERLAATYPLLGPAPLAIRRAKDPAALAALCAEAGIAHPEIRINPPEKGEGWLSKRTGGTGGTHIRRARGKGRSHPGRYFQRQVAGTAISALGIVGASDCAFAFSRQWTTPSARQRYRFGGAVGSIDLDPDLEARMIGIGLDVTRALNLKGLISLDFMVGADNTPVLLEVNPRPGATLDVFDDAHGTLFRVQVAAGRGAAPLADLFAAWSPPAARAVAYLYADDGAVRTPTLTWPDWAHDRPAAGRAVAAGAPLATVIAEGPDAAAAEALCRRRLETLHSLLYQTPTGEGAPRC